MTILNLTIEKNIPIPDPRNKIRTGWAAVAEKMEVGDSVLCYNEKDRGALYNALVYRRFKVASRKLDNGFRVWRIS